MPSEKSFAELATIVSTLTSRPQTVAMYTDTLLSKRSEVKDETLTSVAVSETIAEGQEKSGAAVAQLLAGIIEVIRSNDPRKQPELEQKLDVLVAIDHQPFLLQGNASGAPWEQLNQTPRAFGQVLSRRNKLETGGQIPLYLDSQQVVLPPLCVLQQLYRGRSPAQFFYRSDKDVWGITAPVLTEEERRQLDVPAFALTEEDRQDPKPDWFLPEGRRFNRYTLAFTALRERKFEDVMTCANSLMRGGFHGDRGALAYKAAAFKCLSAGNLPPATMRELEKVGGTEADVTAILATAEITEKDFVRPEPKPEQPLSPFDRGLQNGYQAIDQGEYERAIQAFYQIAKLNRKDPRPHLGRAVAYLGAHPKTPSNRTARHGLIV